MHQRKRHGRQQLDVALGLSRLVARRNALAHRRRPHAHAPRRRRLQGALGRRPVPARMHQEPNQHRVSPCIHVAARRSVCAPRARQQPVLRGAQLRDPNSM
eukprot:6180641-Pleurochrysis_carterae.AAC.1